MSTVTWPPVLGADAIAQAQVAADTTLTDASTVSFDGTTYSITGGTTNSRNLFHSFDIFSLSNGEMAQFDNDGAIENIIARVTGGERSRINGLIEANGDANLFLLNPNGIVFGTNAELNIGGSFLATTADRVLFDTNVEYSAIDPQEPPLLAINTPIGLQFGTNPGGIRVNGPGNNLFIDPVLFDIVRSDRPVGLDVNQGETLALVGGNLVFNGGNITASQGRIELGSVGDNETVSLNAAANTWVLEYDQVSTFNAIRLSDAASVDASGEGGGNVQVYGQTLTFQDGSAILANTLGSEDGGRVHLEASEAIELQATSLDSEGLALLPSGVFSEVSIGGTGNGASVAINTPRLDLSDGAQISVATFAQGNAGSLSVSADAVTIVRDALFTTDGTYLSSTLTSVADVDATGAGGTIAMVTDSLFVSEFAEVSASTFGAGNAGAIVIEANGITLSHNGGIFSNADTIEGGVSRGAGGDITLIVDHLRVEEGGQVAAIAFSEGDGGTIDITAQTLELIGSNTNLDTIVTTNVSDFYGSATGNGGAITVQANSLLVTDGAQLVAATAGGGNAGNLTVDAQNIELRGTNNLFESGLIASAVIDDGDGGNIEVMAEQLTIADGATINVGNLGTQDTTQAGTGDSGIIAINADVIQLEDDGTITASSLNGLGDINLASEFLLLSDQSNIETNASGRTPGGNITIDTLVLSGIGNSNITANAINDRGGQIIITADNVFGFQISDVLNPLQVATNDITASSRLGTDFSGIVQLNTPDNESEHLGVRLSDDVVDQSQLLGTSCTLDQQSNTLVVRGQGGLPESPLRLFDGSATWIDLRLTDVVSTSYPPEQQSFLSGLPTYSNRTNAGVREVNAWRKRAQGVVELIDLDGNRSNQQHLSCVSPLN